MKALRFVTLRRRPDKFRRLTGVDLRTFERLAKRLEPLWQTAERQRLSRPSRQRAIGAGGKYKLTTFPDMLLALLVFYRLYVTYEVLGWLFGLDASTLCRLFARLEPIVAQEFKPSLRPSGANRRIGTPEDVLTTHPTLREVIIDATEQRIQRPSRARHAKTSPKRRRSPSEHHAEDPDDPQRVYYSGKKKAHTIKTQVVVTPSGEIIDVGDPVPGSVHDYTLLKESAVLDALPSAIPKHVDRGYTGITNDFPDHTIHIPTRKPRGGTLSAEQKAANRQAATARIKVEHVIARMKVFQILRQSYRSARATYRHKTAILAGIVNTLSGFATCPKQAGRGYATA